jgi:hypothetical protein
MEPPYQISTLAVSPDGQIIFITERKPSCHLIWRSLDAGKTWYYLVPDLGETKK